MIEVINVRSYAGKALYIGRPSVYGNPFRLENESLRDFVLLQFAEYWYAPEQTWLRERVLKSALLDDKLACYCAPRRCHGDIIAGYINWKRQFNGPKARTVINAN